MTPGGEVRDGSKQASGLPMIRIERITLREIRLPLIEPFRTSTGETTERRVLLLELSDADDVSTWSECVAEALPSYSTETVDTCWLAILEWLAPRLVGHGFASPDEVDAVLARDVRGHRMARAALEMGVWALAAVRSGQPLAALLVAASAFAREHDAAPRTAVESGIAIGMATSPAALVQRAREALDTGYRRIKMKVEPGRDVAFVRAVRQAVGPAIALTADANGSYSADDDAHMRALDSLDALGLTMIEQPLGPDDLLGHADLQRRLATPLCLDESITDLGRARDMLSLGSARIVNLKAGRVGGLREAIAIHDLCARASVPVWCGGMLETGVGRAYNVALASLPGFTEPGDLSPSARYWEQDVVVPEWTMDSTGSVRVPLDRPGLGVDVDTGRIDALTVRSMTLRAR
jgi:O-succinylbenzoate synthase